MLNDMRRIALLILTLFPLLSQSTWAQPFVEIMSITGGSYACEGMTVSFVATPLVEGQGRWVANTTDSRVRVRDMALSIYSPKVGEQFKLAYEFVQSNGNRRDTAFTVVVRPTTIVEVEQQGNRLVVVGKNGQPAPTVYCWQVDGKPSNDYRNAPFENPKDGSAYSLSATVQNGCVSVNAIVFSKR